MIRYKIRELIQKKYDEEGQKITLSYLADQVGIQSSAMSKIVKNQGYNTRMSTIEALCEFFNCRVEDVIEFIPDNETKNKKRHIKAFALT